MTDLHEVKKALKDVTDEYWNVHKKPILLSNLPAVLEAKAPNFKSILGTQTLKAFVKSYSTDLQVKLIEHPNQKAKIAIAPSTETYIFPVDDSQLRHKSAKQSLSGEKAVIALLHSLALLPEKELENINIPVSILVKMIK